MIISQKYVLPVQEFIDTYLTNDTNVIFENFLLEELNLTKAEALIKKPTLKIENCAGKITYWCEMNE